MAGWISGIRSRMFSSGTIIADPATGDTLGILSFEAAAAMARLVSIHRSLSDSSLSRLRSSVLRSAGVAYLNSSDQVVLLRLVCLELLSDLDRAAAAASRLGFSRCSDPISRSFARIYSDAKSGGLADLGHLGFVKNRERRLRKMEQHVASTARLYADMDLLNDLEASHRKLDLLNRHSGPIPSSKQPPTTAAAADRLEQELKSQRQRVRLIMEESLWCVAVDKAVKLMAKSILAILARICFVFGHAVPGLPRPPAFTDKPRIRLSLSPPAGPVRYSAPLLLSSAGSGKTSAGPLADFSPPAGTVGAAGLASRYATIIISAEQMLGMAPPEAEHSGDEPICRDELYEMLPAGIRAAMKAKLRAFWRSPEAAVVDAEMVEGWREAAWRIMQWLAPMAHDTVRWQDERNMDRTQRFDIRPRTMMLQTLHFSDIEKAEAAVVEVLVALSCMCWHDERRGSGTTSCPTS